MKPVKPKLVIITGLSGSGKSIALRSLEDLGYFCIDNLSPKMIIQMLEVIKVSRQKIYKKIAISIDIRSIKMDVDYQNSIDSLYIELHKLDFKSTTVFLHSSPNILLSRFNATRRLHPLTNDKVDLKTAISNEADIMQLLKEKSNLIIDSDKLLPLELKKEIASKISVIKNNKDMLIQLQSFGYKNSIPNESDFVFDVRCLKNPFWDKSLRKLSGKDKKVISFIESDQTSGEMLSSITRYLNKWIPHFRQSDRNYLTISIGCTGGQHRSVYMTEMVSRHFITKYNILVKHRDLK
ncbi:MAG: RNase adapter RapZ [Gammaproteobacteria bacterium]|nr:RNase adapter RapZ [Gammaproteobacteria bacterium]MBT4462915.1 RNase adapter RapZ [Gammaproteobacteria bacterium]MBT4654662.1 RNase adapter RapZ [Gammaproteobacteria bacterium]MBT5116351.1 RNase adapter RapZ [Gammaproteobacteria bacterium]MBT5761348.1 RNase adapter RapZ [Gammaproteobacteria bacterium]